ncbi:MAG TPA: hypothetical protein VGS20_00020 [Candidatus Acidoferrales bacterium]|nr:hypothetical protein [Candidatus Acidoferrales bacterium]HEV2385616.1 hypothetical protein [Candidatus Acidoferrales bacterium]
MGNLSFRHQDIAAVPRGWKVRTITHPSGHEVRIAFPPGPRKKGAGRLISILHPKSERNPEPACIEAYKFAVVDEAGIPELGSPSEQAMAEAVRELATVPVAVNGNPKEKSKTVQQLERLKDKAVQFLRDVVGDDDRADAIDDMTVEEYADKKRVHLVPNLSRKKTGNKFRTSEAKAAYVAGLNAVAKGFAHMRAKAAARGGIYRKAKPFRYVNPLSGAETHQLQVARGVLRMSDRMAAFHGHSKKEAQETIERLTEQRKKPSGDDVKAKNKKKLSQATVRTGSRKNTDELQEAQRVYELFQGKRVSTPPAVIDEPDARRDDFAHLGWLVELVIQPYGEALEGIASPDELSEEREKLRIEDPERPSRQVWQKLAEEFGCTFVLVDFSGGQKIPQSTEFKAYGDGVRVTSAATGDQMYLIGGKQDVSGMLPLFGADGSKDLVALGVCVAISYLAAKHFPGSEEEGYDGKTPMVLEHILGEDGGEPPLAYFNKLQKRIFLAGGTYIIARPGIEN